MPNWLIAGAVVLVSVALWLMAMVVGSLIGAALAAALVDKL